MNPLELNSIEKQNLIVEGIQNAILIGMKNGELDATGVLNLCKGLNLSIASLVMLEQFDDGCVYEECEDCHN